MPPEGAFIKVMSGLVSPAATPAALFLLALIAGTVAFALASLPSLIAAFARVPLSARIGIVLALVLAVLLRRLTVIGLPFHEDFHMPLVMDRIAIAQDMQISMGRGFAVLYNLIFRLFGGGARMLFDVQRLFGDVSVVLLGLLAFEVTASGLAAFAAALLLAANPIHARLSASEDPTVPFVFLLLTATLAVVLALRTRAPVAGARPPRWQPAALVLLAACTMALGAHFRSDFAIYALVPLAMMLAVPGGLGRMARFPVSWVALGVFAVSIWLVLPEVLSPEHDGFRLVTRLDALQTSLLDTWDYRAPNRLVLLSHVLSPSLILLLAVAGFVALFRTQPRLAWLLVLLGLGFSWLFLGSNGFPGNVRHQAPQHFLFLLLAAAGVAWLVRELFASPLARAVAVGGFVAVTLLSYAGTIRTLTELGSPHYERDFLAHALPQVTADPGTVFVRMEGGRDAGFVNTTFPDNQARQTGARLVSVREMLAAAPTMDAQALRPYVFYRGLSCYLMAAYGERGYGPCDNPCRLLDDAYELRPIVEQDIPNVPYESMFLYPSPGDQPMLRIGFYRMFPRADSGPPQPERQGGGG